jgi:hypothetical protein
MITLGTEKSTAREGAGRLYRYAGLFLLLEAWKWIWLGFSNRGLNNFQYLQVSQCGGFL